MKQAAGGPEHAPYSLWRFDLGPSRNLAGMAVTVCPYCALSPDDRGGLTKEHPFIAALGGRGTIRVCKLCNSTLGHTVEAPMMAHNQILNLARIAASGSGQAIRGKIEGIDDEVSYDVTAGHLRSAKPVRRWERTPNTLTAQLAGSPEQVRDVLAQGMAKELQMSQHEVEQMVAEAQRLELADAQIQTTLSHSMPLGHRLAAKVALGAGVMAEGEFGDSTLAGLLRTVMWGTQKVERISPPEALKVLDELIQHALPSRGAPFNPFGVVPGLTSRVVFLPTHLGDTAVFSFVTGFLVSVQGIVLEAPSPFGELAISVTDGSPPVVRRLMDEVLRAAQ